MTALMGAATRGGGLLQAFMAAAAAGTVRSDGQVSVVAVEVTVTADASPGVPVRDGITLAAAIMGGSDVAAWETEARLSSMRRALALPDVLHGADRVTPLLHALVAVSAAPTPVLLWLAVTPTKFALQAVLGGGVPSSVRIVGGRVSFAALLQLPHEAVHIAASEDGDLFSVHPFSTPVFHNSLVALADELLRECPWRGIPVAIATESLDAHIAATLVVVCVMLCY